uniref:C2 domain-containing protein n=1 Tax=Entomoneis paludosa TaxID=265537 RepID=A0A7S2YKD8_9STRA|mmetsp:Transcript_36230/g.75364  ORF Transcript_36230/g.75364 Transcript_36230/m.75364 type:complete len:264 (+) Transcript_36230:57-848(+)
MMTRMKDIALLWTWWLAILLFHHAVPVVAFTPSPSTAGFRHCGSKVFCLPAIQHGGITPDDATTMKKNQEFNAMESRRTFTSKLGLLTASFWYPLSAYALDEQDSSPAVPSATTMTDKILVQGVVTLGPNAELPDNSHENAALYITARPNKPDNVPRAILDGSNGKPPPVLATRIPNPTFPLKYTLQAPQDLTLEGAATSLDAETKLWFEGLDLIVSARWDTDGTAATRDPTDLVARTVTSSSSNLQLTGRGIGGKLVTGKSK